ncbi:hypothetical protein TNCV_773401 [Trichonephila clavipes]|nr:hypothetical protein TNCV_773401 [Trichonephila clavipes]
MERVVGEKLVSDPLPKLSELRNLSIEANAHENVFDDVIMKKFVSGIALCNNMYNVRYYSDLSVIIVCTPASRDLCTYVPARDNPSTYICVDHFPTCLFVHEPVGVTRDNK